MEYIVVVKNISKRFAKMDVLRNISFQIRKGIIFGIIGPNGAGKTTLLNILATLLNYDEGNLKIMGYDLSNGMVKSDQIRKIRSKIGFVPENFVFYERLTIYENLKAFYVFYKSDSEIDEYLKNILKMFGLWDKRYEIAGKLSRGMKQRLNVARALVNDPELLLLDEPFLGLDPYSIRKLQNVLVEKKREGKTIVVASHMIDEIKKICDEVMIIKDGMVLDIGSIESLCERYKKRNFDELFFELTYE